MSNPLYEQIGNSAQENPMQMVQQIRSDPVGFLRQRGLNIPDNMKDPRQIARYLVSSGQRPNALLQMAMQRMGMRF